MSKNRDQEIMRALAKVMEIEGGEYVEADGTLSNRGLNQKTFDSYNKSKNKPLKDVREATTDEYLQVVKDEFLGRHGLENMPDDMILPVLDFSINSGPNQTAKEIQRVVGAEDDGIVGPNTMKKFNDYIEKEGKEAFVNNLQDNRLQFLNDLSTQRQDIMQNLKGLNNRVEKIRAMQLQNIGGNR